MRGQIYIRKLIHSTYSIQTRKIKLNNQLQIIITKECHYFQQIDIYFSITMSRFTKNIISIYMQYFFYLLNSITKSKYETVNNSHLRLICILITSEQSPMSSSSHPIYIPTMYAHYRFIIQTVTTRSIIYKRTYRQSLISSNCSSQPEHKTKTIHISVNPMKMYFTR